MSWSLVPLMRREFDFFERQRSLFSDWAKEFEHDWTRDFESPWKEFDDQLEKTRRALFQLEEDRASQLQVKSPYITDAHGNKKLALRFDVSKFNPEEVTVKCMDKRLVVHAKHQEEGAHSKVFREFTKEYTLPDNVDPAALTSHLSNDGVLMVEAPAPPSVEGPKEILVPIEKM